ncbi:MAG: hypothetical protein V1902_02120 [Candidatus Falkowbacteria bacterium]
MDLKEQIKNVGRQLIGQGREVKFLKAIEEFETTNGVSREQAEKAIFLDRIKAVQDRIKFSKTLGADVEELKELEAAMNEIFKGDGVERLRESSADPAIFRAVSIPPVALKDVKGVESYFKNKFDKQAPKEVVLKDYAQNGQLIEALLKRFASDPNLGARTNSIEAVLAAHPELGADLGKVLEAKRLMAKHESGFHKDQNFEKTFKEFKGTAKETLTEMLWKAPVDSMSAIMKSMSSGSFGNCIETFFKESLKFAGRELWAGTKLFAGTVKMGGSLIKNKLIR